MDTHTGTPEECYNNAATLLLQSITDALAEKQQCTVGIVGGRTVPGLFAALEKQLKDVPEGTIDVFWLDERVTGEKNFPQALPHLEKLAEKLTIQWHPFVSMDKQGMFEEIGVAAETLEELGMAFDIVVVSAGEDGHICSLFPQNTVLTSNTKGWVFVEHAPKPPPQRVTVSVPLFSAAKHGLLFFVGEGKKDAYELFLDKEVSIEDCPAKLVQKLPKADVFVALE